ncbi:hypothetical protein BRDCF_p2060 [Bacteroidales bacterium CF]|nr:hypothetical protein BRDCF_p2060 [Bacteroidales bacterium CF]
MISCFSGAPKLLPSGRQTFSPFFGKTLIKSLKNQGLFGLMSSIAP